MNKLLGGTNCCICPCDRISGAVSNGEANNSGDVEPDRSGYDNGAYA